MLTESSRSKSVGIKEWEKVLVLCSSVSYIGWDPVARIIPTFLYNCPQVHIWVQVIELRE